MVLTSKREETPGPNNRGSPTSVRCSRTARRGAYPPPRRRCTSRREPGMDEQLRQTIDGTIADAGRLTAIDLLAGQ
jgi:hypothetical protein